MVDNRKRYEFLRDELDDAEAKIAAGTAALDAAEKSINSTSLTESEYDSLLESLAPATDAAILTEFIETIPEIVRESIDLVRREAPQDVRKVVEPIYREIGSRSKKVVGELRQLKERVDQFLEQIEVPDEEDVVGQPDYSAETKAAEVERPKRYEGDNLTDDDIDTIVDQWKYVREVANRPKPESLAAFVIARGGIKDDAREVRHIAGAAKERPGLVNKDGWTLDDIALSAWEAGFMGDMNERPTIADFLDRLQDDLHTGTVVRLNDEPLLDDIRIANEIARELADYGVTTNRFRSEATLREYFGQERPATARQAARDEEAEPAAEERTGQARPDQDEVILPPDEAPETGPSDSRPMSRDAFIEALTAGVNDRGNEVIAPNGTTYRIDFKPTRGTYVVVSKEPESNGIAFTKGPGGPGEKWSRPYAAGIAADEAGLTKETGITTEKSGQTSLVPEPTTKEKIAEEAKKKGDRGKANADLDAGELFNPDAGKQTDLVDMAKAAKADPYTTGKDAARDHVLSNGRKTGTEYGMVVMADGSTKPVTPSERNSKSYLEVSAKTAPDLYDGPAKSADLHHNHPKSSSFSRADYTEAAVRPALRRTWVHGHDGSEYWASFKTNDPVILGKAYDIAMAVTERLTEKGYDLPRYRTHMIATMMRDGGVIEYGATLTPARADERIATLREKFGEDAIAKAVEDIRNLLGGQDVYDRRPGSARSDRDVGSAPARVDETRPEAPGSEAVGERGKAQDRGNEGGQVEPLTAIADELRAGGFKTILEARKFAKDLGIEGDNKAIDEMIERAVVQAARQIVADGKVPQGTFKALVDLYVNQPNLASRTGTSVANQAYSTPMPLAYLASRLAGVASVDTVYEPTAGNGALLIEANPVEQTVHANELDPRRAEALKAQGFEPTTNDGSVVPRLKDIDSVIMNPPFGAVKAGGKSTVFDIGDLTTTKIDHAVVLNGLEAMAEDGKAVLIIGSSMARSDKERATFYRGLNMKDAKTGKGKDNFYRVLYDRYSVTDHFTVDGELYKKQGAGFPVDVIVIDGKGKSSRPLPGTPKGLPTVLTSWNAIAEKIPDDTADDRKSDRPARKPVERDERPAPVDAVRSEPDARSGTDVGTTEEGAKPEGVRPDTSIGQPDRGRSDAVGTSDVPAGGRRDAGRIDRDSAPKRARIKVAEGATQAKYQPLSDGVSVDTLVPASMADSSRNAMERVEARRGSIDEFVRDQLGYESDEKGMYFIRTNPETGERTKERPFSAEQIDALAAAIDNVERGDALIVGDATGIGKGRIGAGMLRYAMKKGLVPVLMTEKMDLYGDMYRDMRDIGMFEMLGREPRILTTDVGKSIPLDEEAVAWKADAEMAEASGQPLPKKRGKFLSGGSAPAKDKAYDRLLAGDKDVADVVFTTYSQMQTLGETRAVPRRRSVMAAIAPRAMMVLDETHNAGGQGVVDDARAKKAAAGGRAEFVRDLTSKAKGLMFMSATYAKRPNVMDLYARTDMGKAVEDIKDLPKLIQRGGVPLQQIVASMLAESGQYMRRERSFDGIEYAIEEAKVDEVAYDQFVGSVQSIFKFDMAVKEKREEFIEEILAEIGAGTKGNDSGIGEASARATGFSSIMHNIVSQMLLAIKADAAADRAITALKSGEKPVITLANTNESFISDFAEADGSKIGDTMDIDFGDMLKRYLQRTLRITYKKAGDKKPSHYQIPVERLPAHLQSMYRDVESMIDQGDYRGMPVSPIDWIRSRITKAGYSVREVTGRQTMLDYSRNEPKLLARPKGEVGSSGKRVTLAKFNGGTLDAVILNQSGSTGVSIHASKTFKDQRKRRMILAQAEANVDVHMQMLGRVNRTGQVVLPAYSQLAAGIPAEVRPIIVLMKKMASLAANTTGARGTAFSADSADFMNEVGDKVMAEYLSENWDINASLGTPFDGENIENIVQTATGKLVLLTVARQREMLDAVQKNYVREIAQLDALGENPLEAKTLDLQATTLETTEIKPKQGDSPFLDAVRIEKVSAKAQGRAMKPSDVAQDIADFIKATKPDGTDAATLAELERRGRAWGDAEMRRVSGLIRDQIRTEVASVSDASKESTRRRLEAQHQRWLATFRMSYPGARVRIGMPDGDLAGIVLSVERTGDAKQMGALGSWSVRIAVPDSMRQLEFPMSKLFPDGFPKSEDEKGATYSRSNTQFADLVNDFETARKEGRETRYIVTGNILGGFDQTSGGGRIVNYTTDTGQIRPGILMGRGFDVAEFMGSRRVRFQTGEQIAKFLDKVALGEVTSEPGEIRLFYHRGWYGIETAAAAIKARKFYSDRDVLASIRPSDFMRRGNKMIVEGLSRSAFVSAVDKLKSIGAKFDTRSNQDEAQEIIAGGMREEADQEDFPRVSMEGYILSLPYEKEWGNPRFIKADRERAIARLREIQSINADDAPWADLVQAKRDIDQIITNLFYFSPERVSAWETSDSKSSNDIWLYLHELENPEVFAADRDNQQLRRSLFSEKNIPAELADFADEGGQAIDSLLDSKRKGLSDLLKYDDEIDPVKPKKAKPVVALGDKMPSGFYFKAARKIDEARDTLFQMSGQAVINWLMKEGVSRAEINHFRLWDKFGGTAKFTREQFKQAIGERMFDFRRKMSWLNPERSKRDYEMGGTRAFTGPRVPGQGIYFERPIAFPQKLAGGAQFAPGQFESPHWYSVLKNAWASWRGSIREVPGYGKMLVGEEGQSDYMQGASTGRRPKITEQEFLASKEARPKYQKVMGQAEDFLLRAIGSGSMADRGTPIWDLRVMLGNDLVPTDNGNELPRPAWDKAIELARNYVDEHRLLYSGEAHVALDKLVALRTRFEEFFAPGARDKYDVDLSKRTPESPIDENYVRVMARDLLLLAAEKNVDSISVSTSSTTARIQNNPRAAHFYDQQMKPALERELRKLTGQWDLSLQKIALPKAMGSPKSERPYTVWAAKLEPATLEKIKQEGVSVFSIADLPRPKVSRLDYVKGRLLLRQPVDLADDAKPIFDMMRSEPSILPGMIPEAVITKLTPKKGTDKYIVTARDQYGEEHTFEDDAKKITRTQGQYLVANGRPLVVLTPLDFGGDFVQTVRTVRAHEAIHALRIAGFLPGGNRDAGTTWGRLVGHADLLGVLHMSRADFYKRLGDPRAATASKDVSTFEVYTTLYGHLNTGLALELYHQEAVAHMMEVYVAGGWTNQEIAPVKAILDDILSGKTAQWTDVREMPLSAGMLRSIADNEDGALGTDRVYSLQDTITGQSMRRDLDSLGFYSKALEAAKALKQEKGTPEQMLAQLKKAGVKDAEIEATGLATLFKEKAGSTTALESDAITLPPKNRADYIDEGAYKKALNEQYFKDGQKLGSSRERPVSMELPPVGSWRISPIKGLYGHDIEQLVKVKIDDLLLPELESGKLDPIKRGDEERYAQWLKEGKRPPPIDIVETEHSGRLRVMDGHRRALAAKLAGATEIEAWVSRTVPAPHGKVGSDGRPIMTGLTFEIAQQQGDRTASPPRRARLNQITKADIVKHLEENRVGLREVVSSINGSTAINRRMELERERAEVSNRWPRNRARLDAIFNELADLDMAEVRPTKWHSHSLDPSNPTYRETVIHLPVSVDETIAFVRERRAEAISRGDFRYLDRLIEEEQALRSGERTPEQSGYDAAQFRSGHFPEPNIIGHMMTSMTRHEGKPVYTLDQIQSDWGQKLRDGGVRDEAKIAELKAKIEAKRREADAKAAPGRELLIANDIVNDAERAVPSAPWERIMDWLGYAKRVPGANELSLELLRLRDDIVLLNAELKTAEASSPGHPLVNTTDQWTQTTLRRAIRQAVEAGAEYIAIPTGNTVLSYNPGDEDGMAGFYGDFLDPKEVGIVPKNLRNLLQKIDKSTPPPTRVEKLETPSGMKGEGFTLFPLTEKVKTSVLEDGQPMFSMVPSAKSAVPANVKNISRDITEAISIITRITGRDAVQVEFRDQIAGTAANPAQLAASRSAGFDTRTAGGLYKRPTLDAKALIALATNDPAYDLRTAAGHEAFHHVEEVLANPAEKRLLTSDSEMTRMRALASDEFGMSPSDPRLSRLPATEIRAVAFQRYRRMREEGLANASRLHIGIRRLFDRMIQIFQGVRNVLKGYGYDSYEAIFDRARTGEMADPVARRASDRPVRTLRNLIDPQMRPEGYVEREPFDLKNVRLVGRAMASVPLDAIRTIQKSVSIASVRAKLGLPESDDGRPVSVFKYGNTYYVNDGNHRIEAMRINGAKTIRAEIIEIAPKDGDVEVLADRGPADVQAQPVGAQETDQDTLAALQQEGFDTSEPMFNGWWGETTDEVGVDEAHAVPGYWFTPSQPEAEIYQEVARLQDDANPTGKPILHKAYIRQGKQFVADKHVKSKLDKNGNLEFSRPYFDTILIAAKKYGYDSVRFKNVIDMSPIPHDQVVVFDKANFRVVQTSVGAQEDNQGAQAGLSDSDVQASLIPAVAKVYTARWLRRLQPHTDRIRVYLQDKVLPIRRQEEAIEAASGIKLPEHLSVYTAEAIYHGRAGERLTDLQEKYVEPLTQHLRKSNISFDELGDYLYARHAIERNEAIRQIDPTNDAGSGMTDAEANGIVGMIEQGSRAQGFKTAAGMIDAMIKDARDTLYRAGNLTKEQYDNWTTKYKSYVPLRGFEGEVEEFGIPRVGRGMDIRGPESMQALGRRSKADNPATYVIQQSVQAIIRSEKNRVDKTLYRLIQAHPNPDVWRVFRGEAKRRINPQTGLVEMYWVPPAFAARNKDNVFGVKIAGKQHYMEILHEPLARSLRTAQPGLLGTAPGRAFYSLARFYAQLVTSFNPEFVISNYLRDIQTALMNVGDVANKPDGTRKKIIAEALSFKSIRGVMAALQSHEGRTIFGGQRAADENMLGRKRSAAAQDYAKWFEEYRLAGGKISFIEMNDIDRIKNRVEKSVSEGKTRRALRNVFDLIDNANSAVENGVRLSAYIALRKNGVSQDKAAFAARELTVNFNRKGELGPGINAFYLFFNASVQGSTRLVQALTRSPAVRKGAATIILAGVLIDLLNYSIAGNDDDDENAYEKIDDWKKEKNMIVMLPGRKDYVQIPMPYGYNVLYLFGQKMAALARTAAGAGKEKPEKAIAGLLGAMVESFSPMGAAPSWLQMASPTLLDPFTQIAENKSWFGGKIAPEKLPTQKHKPDSEMFFSTAPAWAIDLARTLNKLSGGSTVKAGYVDVSPESIEHMADFLLGGVGKFIGNIWNTGQRAYNDQEWIPEKTPFVRRVYGKATSESRRRDFYEKWNEVDAAHFQLETYRKAKDFEGMKRVREETPAELAAYEAMRNAQRQVSALRKQGDVINLNRDIDAVEKEKRLKLLIERENEIILRALKTYARLKKEKAPKE